MLSMLIAMTEQQQTQEIYAALQALARRYHRASHFFGQSLVTASKVCGPRVLLICAIKTAK